MKLIDKSKIARILKKNGVVKAGLFGSFARGEAKENSDVDILIEPKRNASLFDIAGIKLEIENAIKKKVDLVEYSTIKPRIKDSILKDEVKIL